MTLAVGVDTLTAFHLGLVAVPDLLGAMGSRAMEHVLSAQLVQRQSECSCLPQALHEKIEYNLVASYVSCVAAPVSSRTLLT